ncbi:hypothetical protein [Rubritalea marina]|uniref:hypothetical protein n=1 Tax=Rubritalea marina TaxID=361055 RepID=UPI0012EAA771|nr:hypothetical protein [Rubritalea marina]
MLIRILLITAALFVTSCSNRISQHTSGYPEAHTLWDKIDRQEIIKARRETDGFASPLQTTRAFMAEVFASDYNRNFLYEDRFCSKYFSASLQFQIKTAALQYSQRNKAFKHPSGHHHAVTPSHKTSMIGAWDLPTSYVIGGSHVSSYKAQGINDVIITIDKAVVDVIYKWGPDTQYPGDQRTVSVILRKENTKWFIEDLYTQSGSYSEPQSFHLSLVQ